jgi:uncharacterized protein YodC (DUF2158 family)
MKFEIGDVVKHKVGKGKMLVIDNLLGRKFFETKYYNGRIRCKYELDRVAIKDGSYGATYNSFAEEVFDDTELEKINFN